MCNIWFVLFCAWYVAHLNLHSQTHSFPTRLSSDLVARTREPLEKTAEEIPAASGVTVTAVATDITTPEGRRLALEACPQPDILVNNAGGPPPGDFRN